MQREEGVLCSRTLGPPLKLAAGTQLFVEENEVKRSYFQQHRATVHASLARLDTPSRNELKNITEKKKAVEEGEEAKDPFLMPSAGLLGQSKHNRWQYR